MSSAMSMRDGFGIDMQIPGGMAMTMHAGDAVKDQLVSHVKSYQRMGATYKAIWETYCDTHFGGTRDPSRHEVSMLQYFLASHWVGDIGAGSAMGVSDNSATSSGNIGMSEGTTGVSKGPRTAAVPINTGNMIADQLVSRVKAFQRRGVAEKELWGNFCDAQLGGIRDPSRHDASTLQQFLETHG